MPPHIVKIAQDTQDSILEESNLAYHKRLLALKNAEGEGIPVSGGNTSLGNIEVIDRDYEKEEIIARLPSNMFPGYWL